MPKSPHLLNPTQGAVYVDTSRAIMYSGGYGCGKTLLGCYWSIMKSINTPNNIGMITSPTVKMLNDNVINTNLLPLLDVLIGPDKYEYKKSTVNLSIDFYNGSVIRLRPFADEGTMRGGDFNWIWLDEAIGRDRIHLSDDRFKQVRARLRRGENEQLLVTTNPGSQHHFLFRYFIHEQIEGRSLHYGSIYHNKEALGPEYIKDMEATYSIDELEGKWFRSIGVVYEHFDHKKHIHSFDLDKAWEYYLAIDPGYNNPFACLLIAVDKDLNIYIVDEYFKTKTTIDEHADYLQANFLDKYDIKSVVADPAAAGDIALLRKRLGKPILKGKKAVLRGIESVQKIMKNDTPTGPQFNVHPSCTNLISELENYCWEEPREGRNEKEDPVKFMDHGLDALRYFCMTILKSKYNTSYVSFTKK